MPSPTHNARAAKIRKLETGESLAILQESMIEHSAASDAASQTDSRHDPPSDPPMICIAIRRGRLALLSVVTIGAVLAFTIIFSGRGVVIDSFDRKAVSISEQQDLLETYNSYSGTVTAALERPLEMFAALLVQVIVLRLMANDIIQASSPGRVTVAAAVIGGGTMYLLANGLSAVNVQVRELRVELGITAEDLSIAGPNLSSTTTMNQSFPEDQPNNPMTNTVLRNLILPHEIGSMRPCGTRDTVDDDDDVIYRIPQQSWMKDLVPIARDAKSLRIAVAKSNPVANGLLKADQLPMNASVAADLLLYSLVDPVEGDAWGLTSGYTQDELVGSLFREQTQNGATQQTSVYVPAGRLTGLLPPTLTGTEEEDREWFLKNSGPRMYNISESSYKNASLRSWNMTFSHVDIEPGMVWVDAVTIEREVASPRLATKNASKSDNSTQSYAFDYSIVGDVTAEYNFFPQASKTAGDRIDMYSVCGGIGDGNLAVASVNNRSILKTIDCTNTSSNSLLVVTRGHRVIADAVINQASTGIVGKGVIVNTREILSVTVARITWQLQNLSTSYNASCLAPSGCMGLDVSLPGSGKRLIVSENALPLNVTPPIVLSINEFVSKPLTILSIRRPRRFQAYNTMQIQEDHPEYIGDILMPYNVHNGTPDSRLDGFGCASLIRTRLATVVNNHFYMEHTLQPTYTLAALFLLQSAVVRDVLNQTWTTQRMLEFSGNSQGVDVYVYIPSLNVLLTFAGCVLLVVANVVVVVWSQVALRGNSDPLAQISTPHTVANVLLNESQFPPLLLTRSVAPSKPSDDNAGAYQIAFLSLKRSDESIP